MTEKKESRYTKSRSSVAPTKRATVPKPTAHWTVGFWSGLPNYECAYCPFATLEGEEAIQEHIFEHHTSELITPDYGQRAFLEKGR